MTPALVSYVLILVEQREQRGERLGYEYVGIDVEPTVPVSE